MQFLSLTVLSFPIIFFHFVLGQSTLPWELYEPLMTVDELREDPLYELWPSSVGCFSRRFGYSGSLENINTICSFPIAKLCQFSLIFITLTCTICFFGAVIDTIILIFLFATKNKQYPHCSYNKFLIVEIVEKNVPPEIFAALLLKLKEREHNN
jgi:hypothetical protein